MNDGTQRRTFSLYQSIYEAMKIEWESNSQPVVFAVRRLCPWATTCLNTQQFYENKSYYKRPLCATVLTTYYTFT